MTRSTYNQKIYEILIQDTIIDLVGKLEEPCGVIQCMAVYENIILHSILKHTDHHEVDQSCCLTHGH